LNPWSLALPLVLAVQFVVTLSLSYLVAAFNVSYRDVRYLLGIILLLGFYLTPVFYDASAIPPAYQAFYHLNPLVTLIESYRNLLLYGVGLPVGPLALVIAGGLFILWLGVKLFRRMSVDFAEEL
jgi:lipopolysaccharide transport system permease protein